MLKPLETLEKAKSLGPKTPEQRRWLLLVAVPTVIVVCALALWAASGRYVSTTNAYVKANRVQISADVSGRVTAVRAEENQLVREGQILFEIDSEPLQIAFARAEADLAQARNDIETLRARTRQKQEELTRARADADFADRESKRQEQLAKNRVASEAKVDAARNALASSNQRVAELTQELSALLASFGGDPDMPTEQHPSYRAAKAALDQATIDLDDATVRAPADGVISQISNFRPGDYVTEGRPVFALIENAKIWIEANMKETDLTYVQAGQPVEVTIDAYPNQSWEGRIASFSAGTGAEFAILPPQNAVGNWVKVVQRIPIMIEISRRPDDPYLLMGMSANIEIDTGYTRLFRPDEQTAYRPSPEDQG
jgi:membrane fusion protein (multidrug efflux system)